MLCKRCPHLVRHGQLAADKKNIEFKNICGLLMRAEMPLYPEEKNPKKIKKVPKKAAEKSQECTNFPFPKVFDYIECQVYITTFKSVGRKNDVVPTKDFQYSEALSGSSITDMELL